MVSKQACSVGPGEKRQEIFKPAAEARNRHIRSADKSVSRADNGSYRGCLTVRGKEEVYARRKRCSEKRKQENIEKNKKNIRNR